MSTPDADLETTVTAVWGLMLAAERFDRAVAEHVVIGVRDATVLNYLGVAGDPVTPIHLSRRLWLRSGTLTAVLDRLSADAYIARVLNPDDRRSVLVALRPIGRRFVAAGRRRLKSVVRAALDSQQASAAELAAQLSRLANQMDAQVDRLPKQAKR